MNKIIRFVKAYIGPILIVAVFIASAIVVLTKNNVEDERVYVARTGDTVRSIADEHGTTADKICEENYPDISEKFALVPGTKIKLPRDAKSRVITLHIAHWNLEPGVREGLAYMAEQYRKLHPNVRVVQNPVPESTYGQWFITQMLGGTAPEIIECGLGVPYPLLLSYYQRYFVPLTEYMMRPNPYNKGNEFENVALRDTTKDGMRALYNADLQEYMLFGLSQFLVRFYYNKDLYRKYTGRTEAPKNFSDFIAVCEIIKTNKYLNKQVIDELSAFDRRDAKVEKELAAARARGDKSREAALAGEKAKCTRERAAYRASITTMIPVANSQYHMAQIENNLFNPITSPARTIIDLNHDCQASIAEVYIAFKSGKIDLSYGPYRAKFDMVAQFASNSMPGFTGLRRDDAVLQFVQQRAVFIATGTWDANTLAKQAEDNGFEVEVMDFPLPTKDDPLYGKYVEGPAYENPGTHFPFGCPVPESAPERRQAAIDFMLFLMGKENNIKLNEMIGWIPCIKNAEGTGILKKFNLHSEGVSPMLTFEIGGESVIKWQQDYALYQVGQLSFDAMRKDFEPFYKERGYKDYLEKQKNWRRSIAADEKINSSIRAKAFLARADVRRADEYWMKYRYRVNALMSKEMDVMYERSIMAEVALGKTFPDAYAYSSEARARIRGR
ncbi:MAG: extracellular solute-binding protein [Spirochaetota bacterium]